MTRLESNKQLRSLCESIGRVTDKSLGSVNESESPIKTIKSGGFAKWNNKHVAKYKADLVRSIEKVVADMKRDQDFLDLDERTRRNFLNDTQSAFHDIKRASSFPELVDIARRYQFDRWRHWPA